MSNSKLNDKCFRLLDKISVAEANTKVLTGERESAYSLVSVAFVVLRA